MFTTPCFIRKNTSELKKKLEELGYINMPNVRAKYSTPIEELKCLVTHPISGCYQECTEYWYEWDFDCGTNEELFLALAALRNDNDYMQWFVSPKTHMHKMSGSFGQIVGMDGHYKEIIGYEWYRYENKDNALTERLNAMIQMEVEDMEFLPHKATVKEIIEHFKDK